MDRLKTLEEIHEERPQLDLLGPKVIAALDEYLERHNHSDEAYATAIEMGEIMREQEEEKPY